MHDQSLHKHTTIALKDVSHINAIYPTNSICHAFNTPKNLPKIPSSYLEPLRLVIIIIIWHNPFISATVSTKAIRIIDNIIVIVLVCLISCLDSIWSSRRSNSGRRIIRSNYISILRDCVACVDPVWVYVYSGWEICVYRLLAWSFPWSFQPRIHAPLRPQIVCKDTTYNWWQFGSSDCRLYTTIVPRQPSYLASP